MHDAFLKFADHAEALTALEAVGVSVLPDDNADVRIAYHDTGQPAGVLIVKAVGPACDGVVYAPTGQTTTDGEGITVPVMAAVPGFHVNLRLAEDAELPEALAAFLVAPQPETPAEIFA